MENTNTELSNKTAAAIFWVDFLALLLMILSRTFFQDQPWLFYLGGLIILSTYCYKIVRDWRAGRKKSVRTRLLFLLLIVVIGLAVGYFRSKGA